MNEDPVAVEEEENTEKNGRRHLECEFRRHVVRFVVRHLAVLTARVSYLFIKECGTANFVTLYDAPFYEIDKH